MPAILVLVIAGLSLAGAVVLTVYGLTQLAGGRQRRTAVAPVPVDVAGSSFRSAAGPNSAVAPPTARALVHFEDQAPLAAEPGVLLNTLWEHITTAECQQGECGGCRLRLLEGQVRWIREPQVDIDRGTHILACSCEPVGAVRCARP